MTPRAIVDDILSTADETLPWMFGPVGLMTKNNRYDSPMMRIQTTVMININLSILFRANVFRLRAAIPRNPKP